MNQLDITMPYKKRLMIGCAAIALYVTPVASAYAASVNVVTDVKTSYARLLFNWQQPVTITPSANGRELTITMDQPNEIPLSQITAGMNPYIIGARQSDDNRRIFLTMADDYPIRNFVSGNSNGVDVLFGGSPKPAEVLSPETTQAGRSVTVNDDTAKMPVKTMASNNPAPAAKPAAPKQISTLDATKTKPSAISTRPADVQKEVKTKKPVISTVAPKKTPTAKVATAPKKPASKAPATSPFKMAEAPSLPMPLPKAKPAYEPPKPSKKVVMREELKPTPKAKTASKAGAKTGLPPKQAFLPRSNADGRPMTVAVQKGRSTMHMLFPFAERTALASFSHGNDVFLVFSNKQDIDLNRLRSVLPESIASLEELPTNEGMILRLISNSGPFYTVARQSGNGYEWDVTLSRRPRTSKKLGVAKLLSSSVLKPQFALNFLQTTTPISFIHPLSGEMVTAIPSYESSKGVFPERVLPDIRLLRTGQGIAFIPHDSNIYVRRLRQGVRIGKEGGLAATPDLEDIPAEVIQNAEAKSHSFYPNALWKAEDIPDFMARKQALMKRMAYADDVESSALRLQLAQLYMSEGMFMEALSLLRMIKTDHPSFYQDNQLDALAAASNFMIGRVGTADLLFNSDSIKDEEEMALWQRLIDITQGERRSFDYFTYNRQYIQNYPPDMRRKIAILAADHALSQKKFNTVDKIVKQLTDDGLMVPVLDYALYMKGRILAETGNLEDAATILEPMIDDVDNNLLRARAAFTLATAKYKRGMMTRPELIAELEPLRLIWRGDAFELNLLNLLGELYINNQDYAEGMRAWREVVSYFPDTATAQDAALRMSETFVDLFNQGKADSMSPLSALALYYEFRELTPLGQQGDIMIQNLADRLAGVDLLQRAASLLEHQVTFRLEKEDRSRVGARLALIHLLDRKPEKTLEVLELTGYGENDEILMRQRNHLAAMSYAKLGKWQRALNALRDDYSREAKFLRTDIYWDTKDWDNVALNVEDLLSTRPDITAPLDEEETQALLRLAIAYSFKNEPDQLRYLRDYFTPLIQSEQQLETFDFLTSGTNPVTRDTITRLSQEMNQMKSFLDNYRISLGAEGLSAAFN